MFSRTTDPFKGLPVEILCHIFDKMEMKDLLECSMVAKHFRKVIVDSSRLQYAIELGRHCAVSLLPATSLVPFSTRLKLIRERERAWRYMDWKRRHTLKLPPTGSVYEFVGGLYANGRENVSRITASISFLELPSTGNEPETLKMWTHAMEDINIIDFTMDPSQDLLVLVALAPTDSSFVYELHLRSIKTNAPHPNAPIPILSCWQKPTAAQPSSDVFAAVRIQISGCLVALLIKEVQEIGAHLEIWNWQCNTPCSSSMTRNTGIDDFTFLTQDSFLLVRPAGHFEVYTFNDPAKDTSNPTLRISYTFPALSPGYMYWYISMSSNPAPGYVPRPPKDPANTTLSHDTQIYYPKPEERIHACCLYIFEPHNEENVHVHSFVFFLNLKTLLNPAEEWLDKAKALSLDRRRRREQATSAKLFTSPRSNNETSDDAGQTPSTTQPTNPAPASAPSALSLFPPFASTNPRRRSQNPVLNPSSTASTSTSAPASAFASTSSASSQHIQPCNCHCAPTKEAAAQRPIDRVPPNTVIPWEIWGPQSTRWFEECINTDWQHALYGLRTVESVQRAPPFGSPIPAESIPAEVGELAEGETGREAEREMKNETETEEKTGATAEASSSFSTSYSRTRIPSVPGAQADSDAQGEGSSSAPARRAQSVSLVDDSDSGSDSSQPDGGGAPAPGAAGGVPDGSAPRRNLRYLRVRDFNPHIFTQKAGAVVEAPAGGKRYWVEPRLVTEPTMTPSKGVFTRDIMSSLPYMEVISKEMFEVTDVMMDDCRMLLLKRGGSGRLERVDVLMM